MGLTTCFLPHSLTLSLPSSFLHSLTHSRTHSFAHFIYPPLIQSYWPGGREGWKFQVGSKCRRQSFVPRQWLGRFRKGGPKRWRHRRSSYRDSTCWSLSGKKRMMRKRMRRTRRTKRTRRMRRKRTGKIEEILRDWERIGRWKRKEKGAGRMKEKKVR